MMPARISARSLGPGPLGASCAVYLAKCALNLYLELELKRLRKSRGYAAQTR
jgi:hypothetical protein